MAGEVREVASQAIKCQSCGAPFTLRGFARTRSVACEYCGSIFDTSTPDWQLIEQVERSRQETPIWPLGTRARLGGKRFDLIGWMKRFVRAGGLDYYWEEHIFFSPYHGFRYLVYQEGHFSLIEPLPGVPARARGEVAAYEGRSFRHFTTGRAMVKEVIGEFPWRVQRGDAVMASDFIAPPYVLSCEETEDEVTWSRGLYMTQAEVQAMVAPFKRRIRSPVGIAPNQPNPLKAYADWLPKMAGIALLAWGLLTLLYVMRCSSHRVTEVTVHKTAAAPGEAAAPPFTKEIVLDSSRRVANVEVSVYAPVDNSWAFVECMLIDVEREHAYPVGVEVEYYHGYDGGESWSEGSQRSSELIANVPNGKYVLQIERADQFAGPVHVTIVRDVPLWRYPIVTLVLLVAFPIFTAIRSSTFETKRWSESDHAGG